MTFCQALLSQYKNEESQLLQLIDDAEHATPRDTGEIATLRTRLRLTQAARMGQESLKAEQDARRTPVAAPRRS